MFFARNIDNKSRLARGVMGAELLTGSGFACQHSTWLAIVLALAGLFTVFEAARGWCAAQACGIKAKM
ncbi:MAG TPA: YgaP-like transmembrane domain [Verrucomicrobiae bacterium]